MARRDYRLTVGTDRQSINTEIDVASVVVNNPTGSPVYVRLGAPDIPDGDNADRVIPAATAAAFPASGRSFGFRLADTALVSDAANSGLFGTVTIALLDRSEPIPSYGTYSFLSLSLSDLTGGDVDFSGAVTSDAFDLGAWGGAIVTILPDSISGQGLLRVQIADSSAGPWQLLGTWAFWPDVPVMLTLPRTLRYVRLVLGGAGISGEAGISGSYAVRATLAEVTQLTQTPSTTPITETFSVAALGSVSYTLATHGLRSVALAVKRTSGDAIQMLVESSGSVDGPWRIALNREQLFSGGLNDSIYRSVGNLDLFTRVTLTETANVAMSGTFTAQLPAETDTTSVLSQILAALGDQGQSPNVGQSIYHQLVNANTALGDSSSAAGDTDAIGLLRALWAATGDSGSATTDVDVIGLLRAANAVLGTPASAPDSANLYGKLLSCLSWLVSLGDAGSVAGDFDIIGRLLSVLASLGNSSSTNAQVSVIGRLMALLTSAGTSASGRNASDIIGQLKQIAWALTTVSTTAAVSDNVYTSLLAFGIESDSATLSNTLIGTNKGIRINTGLIQYVWNALTQISTTGGNPDNVMTQLEFMRAILGTIDSDTGTISTNSGTIATNTGNTKTSVDAVNTTVSGKGLSALSAALIGTGAPQAVGVLGQRCFVGLSIYVSAATIFLVTNGAGTVLAQGRLAALGNTVIMLPGNHYVDCNGALAVNCTVGAGIAYEITCWSRAI